MSDNNANDFIKELNVAYEGAEDEVRVVTQTVALQALRGVVNMSPVDTGRFRGNWNVGVGQLDPLITDKVDKSGAATISQGSAEINSSKAYQVIHLTNSLPYAQKLELGSSKQAPAGMVSVTFSNLQAQFG
ncbi:MAG: HK97 gp10 family phage protein [Parvibaculaceae bacterium]|nr:HK97 gp10 family phage protein [Parvibaculaceae bacterium]